MASKPWGLAAYAIVHDAEGRLLILKRSKSSKTNPGKWELPGGKLEPGERFDDAVRREVMEETGLKVALVGLAGAVEFDLPAIKVVCLIVETQISNGTVSLSPEHDAYKWIDETEFAGVDMVDHFHRFLQTYKGDNLN